MGSPKNTATRDKFEKDLTNTDGSLFMFLRYLPVSTIVWKAVPNDFVMISFNKAADEMASGRAKDFIGKKLSEIIHEEELLNAVWKSWNTKLPQRAKYKRTLASNGSVIWFYTTVAFIPDEYLVFYGEDITEDIKNVEKASTLNDMVESSEDIICYFNLQGVPLFINKSAEKKYGWDIGAAHFAEYFPEAETKFINDQVLPKIIRGESWEGEIAIKNNLDKTVVTTRQRIFPIKDKRKETKFIALTAHDIMNLKIAESKLYESSRLASIGEMAAGVSHEINNPVAIIQGRAIQLKQMFEKGEINKETGIKFIDAIIKTSDRIAKIVKGMRSLARQRDDEPMTVVSIQDVVRDTLELCTTRFKNHGIDLQVSDVPNISIKCRAVQISQVILNLLNNAHDAIEHLDEKWVKLEVSLKGENNISIKITDSGRGIDSQVSSKIMQPFFTTKDAGKGTGLGLSIARTIVEVEHHGHLYLDQKSSNTCFVVELPKAQQTTASKVA